MNQYVPYAVLQYVGNIIICTSASTVTVLQMHFHWVCTGNKLLTVHLTELQKSAGQSTQAW